MEHGQEADPTTRCSLRENTGQAERRLSDNSHEQSFLLARDGPHSPCSQPS